jgi:hypothetical protein
LNSFAFQPVSNLSSSIRLAFDCRIELAFGCNLSIGTAFRVTRVRLRGNIGIGLGDRPRPDGLPLMPFGQWYGLSH